MTEPRDANILAALNEITPRPSGHADWGDVMGRAGRARFGVRAGWAAPAIGALGTVALLAVLLVLFTRSERTTSAPASPAYPPIEELQRPQTPEDRASGVEGFHDSIGVDPATIRLAQTTADGTSVFVGSSGESRVCVITTSPSYGSCADRTGMFADGMLLFPTAERVVGVVTDNVTRARAGTDTVPIVGNTFVVPGGTALASIAVFVNGSWIPDAGESLGFRVFDRSQTSREVKTAQQDWVVAMNLDPATVRIVGPGSDWAVARRKGGPETICLTEVPPHAGDLGELTCATTVDIARRGGLRVERRTPSGPLELLLVPDAMTRLRMNGEERANLDPVEAVIADATAVDGLWPQGWRAFDPPRADQLGVQAIFRRNRTAGDEIPAALTPDPFAPPGHDPNLRRLAPSARLAANDNGVRFWVGGDGTDLCVYATPDQHYCAEQSGIEKALILEPTGRRGGFLPEGAAWNRYLAGIVASGYDRVTIGSESRAVVDGFFAFSTPPAGIEAVFTGPAGEERIPLGIDRVVATALPGMQLASQHVVAEVADQSSGKFAQMRAAPGPDGHTCHWMEYEFTFIRGTCRPRSYTPGHAGGALLLTPGQDGRLLMWGDGAGAGVARVELRFTSGPPLSADVKDGVFLAIDTSPRSSEPTTFVTFDDRGNELWRRDQRNTPPPSIDLQEILGDYRPVTG